MENDHYVELCKKLKVLKEYAELEGSEIGEYGINLCHFANYYSLMSDEFREALILEIDYEINNYKNYTKIIEEKAIETRTVKTLEWINY